VTTAGIVSNTKPARRPRSREINFTLKNVLLLRTGIREPRTANTSGSTCPSPLFTTAVTALRVAESQALNTSGGT
jgi:hypothetical protein